MSQGGCEFQILLGSHLVLSGKGGWQFDQSKVDYGGGGVSGCPMR